MPQIFKKKNHGTATYKLGGVWAKWFSHGSQILRHACVLLEYSNQHRDLPMYNKQVGGLTHITTAIGNKVHRRFRRVCQQ